MTEKEIRQIIAQVCAELDQRARAIGRMVIPSMIGAGLALSAAGCDDRSTPLYSAPSPDGKVVKQDGKPGDLRPAWEYPPMPPYGVPNPDLGKRDLRIDKGPPAPPYMAPDISPPPSPDYMVPFDGGVAPVYMPPPPKLDK